MDKQTARYFLSVKFGGEKVEREVTKEEFMAAERAAGFHSKIEGCPATSGFFGTAVTGRVEYGKPLSSAP